MSGNAPAIFFGTLYLCAALVLGAVARRAYPRPAPVARVTALVYGVFGVGLLLLAIFGDWA